MAAAESFAVFDASWWGVWWLWLLLWGITAASVVAAAVNAVGHWRADRARASTRLHGISFYLHDKHVMELYGRFSGKFNAALRQEVRVRSTKISEGEVSAELAQVMARAKRGVNDEVFSTYIKEDAPITVIGMIIDVLEQEDNIVHVDLRKQEITANRALDKALGTNDKRPTAVRLSNLEPETFVSIRGLFRETDCTDATTTFEAPYRDPTEAADDSQVRLTCAASGLRGDKVPDEVPDGSFPARCLGRVKRWDPDTRRLIVRPIAIFD